MSPIRQRAAGLLATAALLALVVGLPIVLLAVGADPIPDQVPSWPQVKAALTSPDDGTLALGAVSLIAWAAWLFLTGSVVLETASRIRGITTPTLPGLWLPQTAARMLVSTALMLFIAAPTLINAAPPANATPTNPPTTQPAASQSATANSATAPSEVKRLSDGPQPARERAVPPAASPRSSTVAYTVQRGDSLWSIAAERLGAGTRYVEIAQLNTDVLHGRPGFLTPGMVLQLPAEDDHRRDNRRPAHQVTVHRGDTLSEIAEDELGDADRYPEIFQVSRSISQRGGERLTDPDVIDVGWTLNIPEKHKPTGPQTARPKTKEHSEANDQHRSGDGSRSKTGSPTRPTPAKPTTTPGARPSTAQPSVPASPPATTRPTNPGRPANLDRPVPPRWTVRLHLYGC